MRLGPLYHWSPTERREAIMREGLRVHAPAVVHSDPALTAPYVCFATTPSRAWGLSGDMEWVSEYESWDLWQMWPGERDEVHVRPFFGSEIEEVKLYSSVPADRLWYVGTRTAPHFRDKSA